MSQKQNFAFISYNHKDVKHAKWLQKKLESYKLPTEIHNEFEESRYIRPVFRDQTDLNTGILGNVLRDHLEASHFLIVICSPNSAKSEWVSKEVQSFIEWGRIGRIIPLIVEGQPNCYNPDMECFPIYLRNYTKEHPEHELLGISFAEVGREKAFIRVVSRLLDVKFDTLWKRHERARKRRMVLTAISIPIILALLYWFVVPCSFDLTLKDAAHQLPISVGEDGSVGTVSVNGTDYQVSSLDTTLHISSLPGYFRGREIPVTFSATYYDTIQISVKMGMGLSTATQVLLKRDDSFLHFEGQIIDALTGTPVEGAEFSIDGGKYKAVTDINGHFDIELSEADQREYKDVKITKNGYEEFISEDETVDTHVTFMIHRD